MKSTKSSFGPNAQTEVYLFFHFVCLAMSSTLSSTLSSPVTLAWVREPVDSYARLGGVEGLPHPGEHRHHHLRHHHQQKQHQHELHHYYHSPGVELVIRNGAPKGRLAVHHLGIPMIKMTIMLRTAMIKMTIILICCNDIDGEDNNNVNDYYTGCFFNWYPP